MPARISAVMWVYNEAHRLEYTLMKLRPWVSHLFIADNGSTDDSVKIARRYADDVQCFPHRRFVDRACEFPSVEGNWTLGIDADEILTDDCALKLVEMTERDDVDSWSLFRITRWYFRDRIEIGERMHHLRLFRSGALLTKPDGYHQGLLPIDPKRHGVTNFVAMWHDKAEWEQRLDYEFYRDQDILGPHDENARRFGVLPKPALALAP